MVNVCDCIMGSGKTSAAIQFINEHPNLRFIYITPYLSESDRVKRSCPQAKITEPSNRIKEYEFKKLNHTAVLIRNGRNIATTHQAFKWYTQEMLDDIRQKDYVLIVDEDVDVLESYDMNPTDLELLVRSGYVAEARGGYKLTREDYNGSAFSEFFRLANARELARVDGKDNATLLFWTLPKELFTSFKDVYILTYSFEGQSIYHFLQMNQIPYRKIGIERKGNVFRFDADGKFIPEYVRRIPDMIDILDHKRLNDLGAARTALSMNWLATHPKEVDAIRRGLYNYFRNMCDGCPAEERLWGSYADYERRFRGRGYSGRFIAFNTKATNEYKDATHLAYLANPFMNVGKKLFFQSNGVSVNEEQYSLGILIQWIWRSAIRDGKEIKIWLPSSRMRRLLNGWIDDVSGRAPMKTTKDEQQKHEGGDAVAGTKMQKMLVL